MSRRIPTVTEVAAAYRPRFTHELRTEWAVALLWRPLSFLLTPLFAACGATPGAVTLLGLACALLLPAAALSGGAGAWIAVGAIAVAFCVLDCVDGDLARVTGRATTRGAYADFVTDIVYRSALYASIGILADRTAAHGAIADPAAHIGLVVGLACALLFIVARACRLYVDAHTGDSASGADGTAAPAIAGVAVAFLSGLDHLLPLGVLAAGATGRIDWLLAYLFIYSLGDFVLTQCAAWRRLG